MPVSVNPTGFALVRNAMQGICEEMDALFARWAFSQSLTTEGRRACGLFSGEDGGIIVQADSVWPAYFAEQHYAMKGLIKAIQDQKAPHPEAGDLYIFNDPFMGAGSLVDIHLAAPHYHGGSIVAWIGVSAHWPDFGGGAYGGVVPGATDLQQEGLCLSPLKLFKAGRPVVDLEMLITSNCRNAEQAQADLRAQTSAMSRGLRMITSLTEGYGVSVVQDVMTGLREGAKEITAQCLNRIPNGTYKSRAKVDSDRTSAEALQVVLTLDKHGHNMLFNLARSSAPQTGCVNAPLPVTKSAIALALKHLFPELPCNAGFFDSLMIEPPKKSFLAAEAPRAVSGLAEVRRRVMEAVFIAFSKAKSELFPAPPAGSWPWIALCGSDPRDGDSYQLSFIVPAGLGAHDHHDGTNAVMPLDEHCRFPSIERLEKRYPLLFERYRVRDGSAGSGRQRGGFGLELALELRRGTALLTLMADHGKEGVKSDVEGTAAASTEIRIGRSSSPSLSPPIRSQHTPQTRQRECVAHFPAKQKLEILTSGGGGIGDPLDRALVPVRRDAQSFHYDVDEIDTLYGVIIDEDGMKVDRIETEVRRARLKQTRDAQSYTRPSQKSVPIRPKGTL